MPRRGFAPARRTGTTVTRIGSMPYKTGEAIVKGSLVVKDANGELVVFAGGTDAIVAGVALEGAGTKLNFGEPFASQTIVATGRVQEVSIAIADTEQEFSARLEDGGGNIVAPLQTHEGEQYGVAVDLDGQWYIDTSETTTKIVVITKIVPAIGSSDAHVLCKFLPATHQL